MEKTKSVIIVLLVILVIALGGILIYSNVNSNSDNDVNINNENNNNNESVNNNEQNNENIYGDIEQLSPTVYNVPLRDYENKIRTIGVEKYALWLWLMDHDEFEFELNITDEEKNIFKSIPENWAQFVLFQEIWAAQPGDGVLISDIYDYQATSQLKEKDIVYEANNLSLEKLDNCWCEGVEGLGIGEKINIQYALSSELWQEQDQTVQQICEEMYESCNLKGKETYFEVNKIYIENGYCMSEELWNKNARVKKLKVTFDDNKSYIFNLEDTMQLQEFDVEYRNNGINKPINATFEILEVYEGTTYDDTCITTISFDGSEKGLPHGR